MRRGTQCTGTSRHDTTQCVACLKKCDSGQYLSTRNGEAVACPGDGRSDPTFCATCTNECPAGYFLKGSCDGSTQSNDISCQKCLDSCEVGEYLAGPECRGNEHGDSRSCETCHEQCGDDGCYGSSTDECNSCRNIEFDGTCVATCPQHKPMNNGGICASACPEGMHADGMFCVVKCPKDTPLSESGNCVKECSNDRYDTGTKSYGSYDSYEPDDDTADKTTQRVCLLCNEQCSNAAVGDLPMTARVANTCKMVTNVSPPVRKESLR